MRFLVIERVKGGGSEVGKFAELAEKDLAYKLGLQKKKKIIGGGPFVDILADGYILETDSIEEMGEIFFNSPSNFFVEREVHPLGTFADSMEGMQEIRKSRRK